MVSGKFCHECGKKLVPDGCGACGASNAATARFCRECGSPLSSRASSTESGDAPTPARSDAPSWQGPVGWTLAIVMLLAVIIAVGKSRGTQGATNVAASTQGSAAATGNVPAGGAPDISSMSPRERAARLYDRIMRYVEQGQSDSLTIFAPMAMASYEMLDAFDLDARYDYGRVAAETGNLVVAAAQADSILVQAPSHLLGLALAARTAEKQGKRSASVALWRTFLSARDAELLKKLPEYEAHAQDIEAATRLARAGTN